MSESDCARESTVASVVSTAVLSLEVSDERLTSPEFEAIRSQLGGNKILRAKTFSWPKDFFYEVRTIGDELIYTIVKPFATIIETSNPDPQFQMDALFSKVVLYGGHWQTQRGSARIAHRFKTGSEGTALVEFIGTPTIGCQGGDTINGGVHADIKFYDQITVAEFQDVGGWSVIRC